MGKRLPTTPRSRIKNAIRQVFLRSRERAAALKATGHRCAKCGIKSSEAAGRVVKLQVHHVGGIDWDGVIDLVIARVLAVPLVALCVGCHAKEHQSHTDTPTGQKNQTSGNLNRFNGDAAEGQK
jgi:predicted HNH restriction endonuclease